MNCTVYLYTSGMNGASKLSNVPEGPSPRRGLRIQPRVLTLGTTPPLRIALKGLQIEGVKSRIKRLSISRPFRANRLA